MQCNKTILWVVTIIFGTGQSGCYQKPNVDYQKPNI